VYLCYEPARFTSEYPTLLLAVGLSSLAASTDTNNNNKCGGVAVPFSSSGTSDQRELFP